MSRSAANKRYIKKCSGSSIQQAIRVLANDNESDPKHEKRATDKLSIAEVMVLFTRSRKTFQWGTKDIPRIRHCALRPVSGDPPAYPVFGIL